MSNLTPINKILSVASFILAIVLMALIFAPLSGVIAAPAGRELLATLPTWNKEFTPNTIGPGSVSTLIFKITNGDPEPLTDIAFTDILTTSITIADPSGATTDCADATLTAPDGGSAITFSGGRLPSGSTCTISVNVTSSTVGTHTNETGDLTSSAGNSGTAKDDLTVASNRPGFRKSFSPSSIPFGGRSTLTFTIDNSTNDTALASLLFTDQLPPGMVIATPSNASTTCPVALNQIFTAESGTTMISFSSTGYPFSGYEVLLAGETCTITVDVTATVTGDNISSDLTSNIGSSGKASATLDVAIDALPVDIDFTDDPVPVGGTVNLEFTIYNRSREFSASDITFTDNLASTLPGLVAMGLPIYNVCGPGSILSGTDNLTLSNANLPPEGSCTFTTTLQIPTGNIAGVYTNITSDITGTVNGNIAIGTPATDALFITAAPLLTKEFTDNPVSPGENVTLAFTITNTSTTSEATDIEFIDELTNSGSSSGFVLPFPVSVTLPPVPTPPCGNGSSLALISMGNDRQGLELTGGNLTAGATCTFSVTISIPATMPPGEYTNVTEEIYATVDGVTYTGKSASDVLLVAAAPRLTKSFTDDPVLPGDTVTLEFTLNHHENSPGDATNITFTDDLAATLPGLMAVDLPKSDVCGSGSQLRSDANNTFLTFEGGTLSPDETCTFTATLQVPADAAFGDHTNTTSPVAAMVNETQVNAAAASDVLKIPGVIFTKEFVGDPVIAGETVILRFALDNTNSVNNVTGIQFTDDLSLVLPASPDLTILTTLPATFCGGTLSSSGFTLIYSDGSLAPGEMCSFDVILQVPTQVADGTYSNSTDNLAAIIDGLRVVINGATDYLTVQSEWLALSKTFTNDPVEPGDIVTLEFTLTNNHPTLSASNIGFNDNLAGVLSGLEAVGLPLNDVCGVGSQVSGIGFLNLTGGSLNPGASCTFSVNLQVPDDAPLGNYMNSTSQVSGEINGLNIYGVSASDALIISYLGFEKSFSASVLPGDIVTLSFTIANPDANASATLISFTDDLSAVIPGLTAVGLPVEDVCGSNSRLSGTDVLEFNGGALGPASSCVFSVTLQIPANVMPGSYQNTTSDLTMDGVVSSFPATASLMVDPFVSVSDVVVDEGAGLADFMLSLNGIAAREVSVDFDTSDATALAGLDYTAVSNTATIQTGEISTTLSIPILEDTLDEANETFAVILSNPVNAAILDGGAVGTIFDDDDPPSLSVESVRVDEGVGMAVISVTLSTVSGLDVSVDFVTNDGTASAGLDYTAVTGTLTIPAGDLIGTFQVAVLEDIDLETDETVFLVLSNSVNANLDEGSGVLTIIDNDYGIYLPLVFSYKEPQMIYENDFEDQIGDAWSNPIMDTAPNGERFLGQFATDAITMTLSELPPHAQIEISFDLYIIRSWDGNDGLVGPDIWELTVNQNTILTTTFSNWNGSSQAFPGVYPGGSYLAQTDAVAINTLGYYWNEFPQDAIYRLSFIIDHTASDLEAVFASGLQVINDESWGLDNVEVNLIP